MLFRVVSLALWASIGGITLAPAQSVADIAGPTNVPPAGFKGQQFVDNSGCVFMRAGYGGQTNWVPRVTRDRKGMCGYPPTFGPQPVIETVPDAVPAPMPKATPVSVKPMPYAKAPPQPVAARPVAGRATASGVFGCYAEAPVAEEVSLASGGAAIVCTRGDGTATGWRPPVSVAAPVAPRGKTNPASGEYVVIEPVPTPPKGYQLAWKDDRLNPWRGIGTDQGWADQDQVWTRTVPARLVTKKQVPVAQLRRQPTYATGNSDG
jgi:hypothetical protein